MSRSEAKAVSAPGLLVALCFGIAALEGFDIQAFGVAAPRLAPELGLDGAGVGWAATSAMVGLVLGALGGGWLADRIGRKPVLVASVAAFGVFSIATALAHDSGALVLARLATGLGFGGAMPNLIAIATEISRPERRAATTTTMFCGLPVGGACVALLARLGGESLDWRSLFMIGGALPLLLTPLILWLMPETRQHGHAQSDRRLAPALFAEGRGPKTLLLWVVFVLDLLITYLLLNWLPTLVVAKGLSQADGASASLAMNLSGVAGSLLLGLLADRFGFRWPLALSFLGLAAAMVGLAGATGAAPVLILSGACGFCVVGALYVLYALAPTFYPPQVRAAAAGAAVAVGRLGSIAGPLIAGELRGMGFSAGQVFAFVAPTALVAALAAAVVTTLGRSRAD